MDQNKCNVCNKSFNSPQELQEHQRTAHATGTGSGSGSGTGRKDQGTNDLNQPNRGEQNPQQERGDREKKIAS
jgi:hypothetical protein